MTNHRTYSLSIKGEQHTYSFEPWTGLPFEQLCILLSDLTGYKVEYLKAELVKTDRSTTAPRFDRLGYASLEPANGFGGTPTFLIRSIDGGPPAA
jgi:hypothetical protein